MATPVNDNDPAQRRASIREACITKTPNMANRANWHLAIQVQERNVLRIIAKKPEGHWLHTVTEEYFDAPPCWFAWLMTLLKTRELQGA